MNEERDEGLQKEHETGGEGSQEGHTVAKKPRGFATWPKDKLREAAHRGGVKAHALGVAFEFQMGSEKARAAGRAGGRKAAAQKRLRGPIRDTRRAADEQ